LKFTEDRLYKLHKIVKKVNELDIGDFVLPERFGIFSKEGNLEAVLMWNGGRYELELVSEEDKTSIQAHKDEVENVEVKEK
jgi:hypothetical protein